MSGEELPEGWANVALLDVGVIQNGPFGSLLHRSDYVTDGIPLINPANIVGSQLVPDPEITVGSATATSLSAYLMYPGDVVIGRRGEMGRAALVPAERPVWFCGTGCAFVRPGYAIIGPFLAHWFGSPDVRARLEHSAVGATMSNLSTRILGTLEIALPPLAEQRRIVEKVEALLEQVNRMKGRLERVSAILKRFRQSVLEAACLGHFTGSQCEDGGLPSGWTQAAVEDLIAPGGIFDGARDHGSQTAVAQNLRTVDYTTSGVRVIRLENLAHLRFIEDKRTYISEAKYAGLIQNTIYGGDILFGSFIDEQVRVCLFPPLDTPAIAKADCFCIRVRPDAVDRDYLTLQLATKRTHDSLIEVIHGATRPRINTKQLRQITVPICSRSEQREIVAIVNRLFALADTIERRVNTAKARVEKLPQAILSKAFSGELVPTEAELARLEGRTYESAEALLARVRNEPAKTKTATKPARKRGGANKTAAD